MIYSCYQLRRTKRLMSANMRLHVIIADVTLSKLLIRICWTLLKIKEKELTAILKSPTLIFYATKLSRFT